MNQPNKIPIMIMITKTMIRGNFTEKKPKLIATGLVFKTTKITAIKATTKLIIKFICFRLSFSIISYFLEANSKEILSPRVGNKLYNFAAIAKLIGKFNSLLSVPK